MSDIGDAPSTGMVLVIDNYDSFTYNLVQYLQELGEEVVVRKNDECTVPELKAMRPTAVVVSPGPCTPADAGVTVEAIKTLSSSVPLLGVCLGHEAIGVAFGGKVVRAEEIVHGRTSRINHTGRGIFLGIPSPFTATRYHSLCIERGSLPQVLELTAWTQDDVIMGVQHRQFRTFGVQFHPESIATEHGHSLLRNFLAMR